MKIIISPAKKMRDEADGFPIAGLPRHLTEAKRLLRALREMDDAALQSLWKCNDSIARLNLRRVREMDLERNLTPAILAYDGLQYRHMAPDVFTQAQLDYVQARLRILSGFYGVLAPLDGTAPYRLEMQARLIVDGARDLYDYWGDRLYRAVLDADRTIVNLASEEYARAVERWLQPEDRFITVVFLCPTDAGPRVKGTLAKAARGEMVRFMAEAQIREPSELRDFRGLNFVFQPKRSDDRTLVFLQQARAARQWDF